MILCSANAGGAIVAILIFVAFVLGIIIFVRKLLKKFDPSKSDTSVSVNASKTQDFITIDAIDDYMISLGGHRYRAIVECSSVNYGLKNDMEKEEIDVEFQRFLNSVQSPICFYIQTQTINESRVIQNIEEQATKNSISNPSLRDYADKYIDGLKSLSGQIGNDKCKKKYVIVSYDGSNILEDLTNEERYKLAQKELYQRASSIKDGLEGVGLTAKILKGEDLYLALVAAVHRDNNLFAEDLANGVLTSQFVSGVNRDNELPASAVVDSYLDECMNKISERLLQGNKSSEELDIVNKVLDMLRQMRNMSGSYFELSERSQFMADYNDALRELEELTIQSALPELKAIKDSEDVLKKSDKEIPTISVSDLFGEMPTATNDLDTEDDEESLIDKENEEDDF